MSEDQIKLTFIFQAIHMSFDDMTLDEFKEIDARLNVVGHLFDNYDYYHYLDQRDALRRAIVQCEENAKKQLKWNGVVWND